MYTVKAISLQIYSYWYDFFLWVHVDINFNQHGVDLKSLICIQFHRVKFTAIFLKRMRNTSNKLSFFN